MPFGDKWEPLVIDGAAKLVIDGAAKLVPDEENDADVS